MTAAERGSDRRGVGCADHRSAARCHPLLCPFFTPGAIVVSTTIRRRVPSRIKGSKGIRIMCIHTFRVRICRYGWMHCPLVSAGRCPLSGYGRRSRVSPCIHSRFGGGIRALSVAVTQAQRPDTHPEFLVSTSVRQRRQRAGGACHRPSRRPMRLVSRMGMFSALWFCFSV